jgi:hypothetical protein
MKFFRLLARIRYWRNRALRAETRIIEISAQAEAERYRNMSREDAFASAACLQGRGMVGIVPRDAPAETRRSRFVEQVDPWQALTRIEKDEFEKEWLVDAITHGVDPRRAQQDYLKELARRKQFNDEPTIG